jgi:type 1 glutamine amidotransferase
MKRFLTLLAAALLYVTPSAIFGQAPAFHALAFYSTTVEADHVAFAEQAIAFYKVAATKDNFDFKVTTRWDDLNASTLSNYQVVLWLDDSPHTETQRRAFEEYMGHGGAWLGFHAAGYNDGDTHWPWFVDFLGGAVFYGNNWPPLPAKLIVDGKGHPGTKRLPPTYLAPANEWYSWKPDPRSDKDVKVLVTLDPSNYPLGLKDTLTGGDVPVVWTNTKFKMVYMNMGHGDKIFTEPTQNLMFEDTLLWLGGKH